MTIEVLPASEARAREYGAKNSTEIKTLLPSGRVVSALPVTVVVDPSSESSELTLRLDETTNPNITYIGQATTAASESSAVWRMRIIDESTGVMKMLWANGNSNFTNKWTERVLIPYS